MNRTGKPLHAIISTELKSKILSGEFKPGDMLPSENNIAMQYKTSRVTVRKSLQMLENEGFIYAYHGKGYFVATPAHEDFLINFSETEMGCEVVYREINVDYPARAVSEALEISPSQLVIDVCRVIKKRGAPVALDIKYIPYEKGMPTLEAEINYAVFPEIAAAKKAPFAFHTRMEIGAELPNKAAARQLQCPMDIPLLVVYRWLIDKNGKCFGYGVKYMLKEYGRLYAKSGYEL
jgi:GntR family transcriptional regulator